MTCLAQVQNVPFFEVPVELLAFFPSFVAPPDAAVVIGVQVALVFEVAPVFQVALPFVPLWDQSFVVGIAFAAGQFFLALCVLAFQHDQFLTVDWHRFLAAAHGQVGLVDLILRGDYLRFPWIH